MATAARNRGGRLGQRSPMPVGDIPGWRQVFTEDFNTDVPVGGFVPKASGSGAGGSGYLNQGGAADAPYGGKLTVYPSGFGAGDIGKSRPEQVLSVSESHLVYNFNVNTAGEYTAATVQYLVGGFVYNGAGPGYYINPDVGIRIETRFKIDGAPGLGGWGAVAQLIPSNTDWGLRRGELDFLEGSLYGYAPHGMETNWHPYKPYVAGDGAPQWGNSDWGDGVEHTVVVEWLPYGNTTEPTGRESVWIDGNLIDETRTMVARDPRKLFMFQTGVNTTPPAAGSAKPGGGVYPANGVTRGRLMVDYLVAYVPTTNGGNAARNSGGRLSAVPSGAARMSGGQLGVTTRSAGRMRGGQLSVTTGPVPGRYRYDAPTGTWRPVLRHRYNATTATWEPRPYGTL